MPPFIHSPDTSRVEFFGVGLAARLHPARLQPADRTVIVTRLVDWWIAWRVFRDTRERCDFQNMPFRELFAQACADELREEVAAHGVSLEALEWHLDAQKRFILRRTEQCDHNHMESPEFYGDW